MAAPLIEAADCTASGSNTATTSPAIAYPAYENGDLLLFHLATDGGQTHTLPSAGPNSETINTILANSTGATAGSVCVSAFWFIGSATTGSGTLTATTASQEWKATVAIVPAGEFDATTPIDSVTGSLSSATNVGFARSPSWTTSSAVTEGRVVAWLSRDADPIAAAPSGWTNHDNVDIGAVSGCLATRDATVGASTLIDSADWTSQTDAYSSLGYVVNEPAAAANVIRTPDPDTLILAEQVPTVFREDYVNPAQDALILAEQVPIVIRGTNVSPAVRALVLAEQEPTAVQRAAVTPAQDALVLVGQAPIVFREDYVNPAQDALVLVGQAPTVSRTTLIIVAHVELNLVVARGLNLTGYAPLSHVGASHTAEPPADTLVLAEQAPTVFREDYVTPAQDALVLAGQAPAIVNSKSTSPGSDTLVLTGQAPTVLSSKSASPAARALTLAGEVPFVDSGGAKVREPGADTLLLAGKVPTITVGANVPIATPVGPLNFTGHAPSRAAGLLLRGYAPNITFAAPLPAAGVLTLSGEVPIASLSAPSITVSPSVRLMELEGYVPLPIDGGETNPPSLILEGWAPVSRASSPTFFPARGQLTFTGRAPVTAVTADIGTAPVTLNGKVPLVALSNNLVELPLKRDLTLTGVAPLVSSPGAILMTPAAATLTLTPQPTFLGRSITPPAVARRLNGKVPLAGDFINPVKFPAVVALTLAGQAPSVNVGWSPLTGEGALLLTGAAPTLVQTEDHFAAPGVRQLQFTEYAPVSDATLIGVIPSRALLLTGYGPTLRQKKIKYDGGRLRITNLTTHRTVKMLYD